MTTDTTDCSPTTINANAETLTPKSETAEEVTEQLIRALQDGDGEAARRIIANKDKCAKIDARLSPQILHRMRSTR